MSKTGVAILTVCLSRAELDDFRRGIGLFLTLRKLRTTLRYSMGEKGDWQ